MSQFLQNLIGRHQEVGNDREISHKIQPRLKTKFETDTRPDFFAQNAFNNDADLTPDARSTLDDGFYATQNVQDFGIIVPIVTAESRQSTLHSHIPTQHSREKPATESNFSRSIDVSEPIETTIQQPGQKPSVAREVPIRAAENRNSIPPENATENFEPPGHFTNPHSTLPDEISQRIQIILHHLNSGQSQHEAYPRKNKFQQKPANTDPGATARTVPYSLIAEQNSDLIQSAVKLKKTTIENQPTQRESTQAGVMQIPGWLTEMQVELNNRYQQMNATTKPEPVINVTIGRVEVKAVQAEAIKNPKARNKPSGVMGLEEYLKQRQSRGRG